MELKAFLVELVAGLARLDFVASLIAVFGDALRTARG
jgi:hypothetical protein